MTALVVPVGLSACEEVISRGMQSFVEIGQALVVIRDGRLYREACPTFESYCESRWGWSRSRAHRIIEASEVTRLLPIGNNTPENEGQARELVGLEPEVAAQVMTEAANSGPLTAASIKIAREKVAPRPPPDPTAPAAPRQADQREPEAKAKFDAWNADRLANDPSAAAHEFRRNLHKALKKALDLSLFDTERVVEVADADLLYVVNMTTEAIAKWAESMHTHLRGRGGLRPIQGGRQ